MKNHPVIPRLCYEFINKSRPELLIWIPRNGCKIDTRVEPSIDEHRLNFNVIGKELNKRFKIERIGRGDVRTNVKFILVSIKKEITIIDELNSGKIIIEENSRYYIDVEDDRKFRVITNRATSDLTPDTSTYTVSRSIKAIIENVPSIYEVFSQK